MEEFEGRRRGKLTTLEWCNLVSVAPCVIGVKWAGEV